MSPADQGRGFIEQIAQRAADMVGTLLAGQQQRFELAGCGQAQLGEREQDLAAEVRAGLRRCGLPGPGRFYRYISS